MASGMDLAAAFKTQARALRDSRVNASLLRGAASDIEAGGVAGDLLGEVVERGVRNGRVLLPEELPARFAAAVHLLALRGGTALSEVYPSTGGGGNLHEIWPVAREVIAEQRPKIVQSMIRPSRRTDPSRAAMLLAALAFIGAQRPDPVRVFDVGAGAGLMLAAQQYKMDFFGETIGPPASKVDLGHPWSVAPGIEYADVPHIVELVGADISPLDVRRRADLDPMVAWTSPDVPAEAERLLAACDVVLGAGITVEAMASSVWLPRGISWPRTDAHTVVWHSDVVLEMSVPERTEFASEILGAAGRATEDAPLSVISFEPIGADYLLYADPVGASLRRRQLRIEPHRFELRVNQWPSGDSWVLAVAEPTGQGAHWGTG